MPEPLKNLLDEALVRQLADRLHAADPAFDRDRFQRLALDGLLDRELKARMALIADALEQTLPADFEQAARQLDTAIADGLAGWALWPVGEYVARRGLGTPDRALAVLHGLTQRFTAEFAVRPFIVAHPALAFATLQRWTTDPSEHVRRLASEGSRPRLPWGLQLKGLIADPTPTLPLLEALLDDPSEYVRRSVANHLNDIAKDHPHRLADWLERHLPGASPERRALLRHASRTLVKAGNARVLQAWGLGTPLKGTATLAVSPDRIRLGEAVTLTVEIASGADREQSLVIDYAVHHVKARGGSSPKVFKGWTVQLAPGESRTLRRQHAVKPITTRRYFSGTHRVELLVNGQPVAEAAFGLQT